jgi:glycosyltransferase involved in cell wall biosynthesis
MQTGPAPRQPMRSWLIWTGLLEWFNVALFAGILWWWSRHTGRTVGPFVMLGFLTLAAILIQGGGYWLVKWWWGNRLAARMRLALLRGLYRGDLALLLIFPLALFGAFAIGRSPSLGDAIFGVGLYLFGFGEFIHYFVWKINMRPREWRRFLCTGQPIPARFRREYERARHEPRRSMVP